MITQHDELHGYHAISGIYWTRAGGPHIADERPTDAAIGVLDGLSKELNAATAACRSVIDRDVAAFNRTAGGLGLRPLGAPR